MRRLASLFLHRKGHEEETTIVECRRCGTSIEPAENRCTACGSEEFVRYTIS